MSGPHTFAKSQKKKRCRGSKEKREGRTKDEIFQFFHRLILNINYHNKGASSPWNLFIHWSCPEINHLHGTFCPKPSPTFTAFSLILHIKSLVHPSVKRKKSFSQIYPTVPFSIWPTI